MKTTKIIIGTALLASALSSQGAVLAAWDFGTVAPTIVTATTTEPGVSTLNATSGAGFTLVTGTTDRLFTNGTGGLDGATTNDANGQTVARTNNEYFSLTLSATNSPTTTLSIDSFVFEIARSSAGPQSYFVTSSVDGHTAILAQSFSTITTTLAPVTVNLDSSFDSLAGNVEFRVYVHGRTATTNTNSGIGIDNATFNGTVIPEPTTTMLGALGVLALLRRRR